MFDTGVTLTAVGGFAADELEQDMLDVLAAVEQHAGDVVLGPAVALNLASSTIDLAFTVCADRLSQVQPVVERVLKAIEQHTDVKFSGTDTHTRRPAADVYALSC